MTRSRSSTAAAREATEIAQTVRRPVQRWLVLAGLVWRTTGILVVTPAAWVWLQFEPWLLGATGVVLLANAALIIALTKRPDLIARLDSWWLLIADAGSALGLNLLASWLIPVGTLYGLGQYRDFFAPYLWGTVIIWTGMRGPLLGFVVVVLAAVPLQIGMARLNEYPLDTAPIAFVDRNGWLIVSFVLAVCARSLSTRAASRTARESRLAGRAIERARMYAQMHDTAIQEFELIARRARDDTTPIADRLREIAVAAEAQAAELRNLLAEEERRQRPFAAALDELADEYRSRHGITTHVTTDQLAAEPSLDASIELLGVTREVLNNVVKHVECTEVAVVASSSWEGVEVVISDRGRGFDRTLTRAGFGMRNSIDGRMRAIGGSAEIVSSRGRGTRVTLWAPS